MNQILTPAADYTLVRSRRRTISLEIDRNARVIVRAPLAARDEEIQRFVNEHRNWILEHQSKMREREKALQSQGISPVSPEEVRRLADRAMREIPPRVANFAGIIGVSVRKITIRNQTTVWGSCTAGGNLNFNCLLMLMDQDIIDYVIVHELCHRLEMNHSPRFWAEVGRVLPDYRERRKWLKEYGGAYIEAMRMGAAGE